MQISTILRILGTFLMLYSTSMLVPILICFFGQDPHYEPFLWSFFYTFLSGFLLWLIWRNSRQELKVADGFLLVVLFWVVLCSFASLPFVFSSHINMSFVDMLFESVSGLTTTGASVIPDLNILPVSLLYYRQQLHFLGGMGIIVLAIAVLPMLGVGGMQLYRAEASGLIKEKKLTPRIAETAKTLWYIYVGLNLVCIFAYWLGGMSILEAIGEGFSTVATGGFSMHNSSFAHYNSVTIEIIAIIFMLLSATNYGLHFLALNRRKLSCYWADEEFKFYIYIMLLVSLIALLGLYQQYGDDFYKYIEKVIFAVVSLGTTTGFVSQSFHLWPTFVPFMILILALVGGCAGSTSGGMKVLRVLLLKKQVQRELHRLMHPQAVTHVKLGHNVVPSYLIQAVWGFVAAFVSLFVMLILILLANGLDLISSFSAATAAMANAGASIGSLVNGFENINPISKMTMIVGMLAGRLEIFTLFILFTPVYWRR